MWNAAGQGSRGTGRRSHLALVLLVHVEPLAAVSPAAGNRRSIAVGGSGTFFRLPDKVPGSEAFHRMAPEAEAAAASLVSASARGVNDTVCQKILGRVKSLIEFDLDSQVDRSQPIRQLQLQVARDLAVWLPAVEPSLLLRAQEALGHVSLGTALRMGSIWTAEDHNSFLIHCKGVVSRPLEEQVLTNAGDKILQGDMVDASCDEHVRGKGESGYRGCQTRTRSGLKCQRWDSQKPHAHAHVPEKYPNHDLAGNFCRNPNGRSHIWCYTTDEKKHWEYCDQRSKEEKEKTAVQSVARWTKGTVHYCYDNSTSTAARTALESAMKFIKEQVPCLKFKKAGRKSADACAALPSVLVTGVPGGCWAHVGQVSGSAEKFKTRSQFLNLGPGCELQGLAAHQLGHLLGLGHEVTRGDRDEHLTIFEESVVNGINVSFPKNSTSTEVSKGDTDVFDLLSLMMSGPHSFTKNGTPTFEPKRQPALRRYLGQRLGFSQVDIERLGEMYGCSEKVAPQSPSKVLSKRFLDGAGMISNGTCRDENRTGVEYVDSSGVAKPYFCSELASRCLDKNIAMRLMQRCPATCLVCTPALEVNAAGVAAKSASVCADAADSGIKYRSGAKAPCSELLHFCGHSTLGEQVKAACRKTCGVCTVSDDELEAVQQVNSTGPSCFDQPGDASPVFTIGGKSANCSELRGFCHEHEDSKHVLQKCPATCGLCNHTGNWSTTTTTASTATYTFSTPVPDSQFFQGVGCSRRRRWGFCQTRRRRFQ